MEFWIIQVILILIITPLHFGLTFTNPEECQNISGNPPTPIEKFHCLVDNWLSMKCWFDLGVVYKRWNVPGYMTVNITMIEVKAGIISMTSNIPEDDWTRKEDQLEISIPQETFSLAINEVNINITNIIRGISAVSCFIFNPRIYVKPEKITLFSSDRNATFVKMTWTHSNKQMPKVFRVRYRSEYSLSDDWNQSDVTQLRAKSLDDTKFYTKTLKDLWPFTNYTLLIDVKPLFENGSKTGFWSDSFQTFIKTDEDVPAAVPELLPGYFSQLDDPEKIRIFWKPIDKKDRCGIITNYKITIQEVVPFGEKENFTLKIEDIPPEDIWHDISIDLEKKHQIKLTQRTKIGYPKMADAHIYFYPLEIRPVLNKFMIAALNSSTVVVIWKSAYIMEGITDLTELASYHVVWCKSAISFPGDCQESINSMIIPHINKSDVAMVTWKDNTYQFELLVTINGTYSEYQFGMSAEAIESSKGLFSSSGIKWYQDCIYLKGGVPKVPLDLKIPQDHDQKDGIYIRWDQYTCVQSVGEVETYIVNYCEASEEDNKCLDEEKNDRIPSSLKSHNYTLKTLTPGKMYLIRLTVRMADGKSGPWSNREKVLFKKTAEIINSESENLMLGAVIGGVVAFVVLAIVVIIFLRRHCRRQAEDLRNIEVPVIMGTNLDNIDRNGSGSDTRESRQPLLRGNHSANDSGLGGSMMTTNNGNSHDLQSLDKIYSQQNGSTLNHHNPPLPNGNVHSPIIEESPGINSSHERSVIEETSFVTGLTSGETDINSGYTSKVSMHTSDEDDSSVNSVCSDSDSHISNKKIAGKEISNSLSKKYNVNCDSDNRGFLNESSDERGLDSNIESYCIEGENSAIDSYTQVDEDSGSGVLKS